MLCTDLEQSHWIDMQGKLVTNILAELCEADKQVKIYETSCKV